MNSPKTGKKSNRRIHHIHSSLKHSYISPLTTGEPLRDRFIPERLCTNLYEKFLAASDFEESTGDSLSQPLKLLSCGRMDCEEMMKESVCQERKKAKKMEAFKILDAPGLEPSFTSREVDWSSNDVIAVGIENSVYTLTQGATVSGRLLSLMPEYCHINCLKFNSSGLTLSVGLKSGVVIMADSTTGQVVNTYLGQFDRITCCDWKKNGVLASGSKDGTLLVRDWRSKEDCYSFSGSHKQGVLTVEWAPDGQKLASGSEDCALNIWDTRKSECAMHSIKHACGVRGLAWCPFKANQIISSDTFLKSNDISGAVPVSISIPTIKQCCSLIFSPQTQQLISASTELIINPVQILNFPKYSVDSKSEHKDPAYSLLLSPDKCSLLTASFEALRFYQLTAPISKVDCCTSPISLASNELR